MPISTTSLNYNFASLEASRAAAAARASDPTDPLGQALGTLQPGTTVTARYQYRVGTDGTLTPTETQITTEANDTNAVANDEDTQQRSRQTLSQQSGRQRQNLADISKPRAQLSPSDEVAIFGAVSADQGAANVASQTTTGSIQLPIAGEAVASDGTKIDVEILPPNSQGNALSQSGTNQPSAHVLDLAARAQSSVAALYARNNDIVYNITPLAELAA